VVRNTLIYLPTYNYLLLLRTTKWQNGKMAGMAEWQNGRMAEWQNGRIAEWQNSKIAEWQNGRMAEWQNDRMAEWQNDILANGTTIIPWFLQNSRIAE
jgi:hypothetical protein